MSGTSKNNSGTDDSAASDSLSGPQPRVGKNATRGLALKPSQVLQFVQAAPFAFAVFDRDMVYHAHSERWVEDYNLDGTTLIGRSQYEVFPNMSGEWRDRYNKCLTGHVYESQESTFTKPSGQVEWIKWHMSPWTGKNGAIGGLILFTEFITQQKLKAKELQKNQQFLTAVLDSVQDGIVACDANGKLTLFNSATRALHGLPEQPIPAERWADHYNLYHPDGKRRLATEDIPLFRALKGEKVQGAEIVIAPTGREPRRIISRGQALRDGAGKVIGAGTSMNDITEQSKEEEELRGRELQFQKLYNETPVMLHSVNVDGELVRVSDYWLKTLGYTREEVIGRRFLDLLPEDSQQYLQDYAFPEFVETGLIENVEFKLCKKDGTEIDVQFSATALRDETGDIVNSLTVMSDVTDRKRMERALRRSESQFRGAFQTSPQGMALVSPSGTWLTANTALCEIFGFEEKELLGQGIQKLTHPEDIGTETENIRQMLAGEKTTAQFEKRYLHKNGSTIWALVSITLVRDENSEPFQFVFQMLDLTKRKDVEQQLLQSQKLEAVGQLTGGLAHDFNNILAVNMISLQLLERAHQEDEKSLERIRAALDATERGAELTRRLLAFSRKQNLEEKVIDVNHLIENTRALLSRTLGAAIKLETHAENNIRNVKTDENQLESALLNLAINARDAMPDGGDLTIETKNVDLDDDYVGRRSEVSAGRYVLVAVTDTGAGIPKDILDKVFQPFFTTKEVGRGTGLGLSMVYGFVKQSKGHIEVYSEVGIGTSIKMYLPACDVEADDNHSEARSDRDELQGGSETILVTEDDESVRGTVCSLLESFGYIVIQAGDAASAISILDSDDHLDLLFSDIVMPGGMNGVELADKARELRPGLRVLLTTGFAEAAIAAGTSFEIVGKPYRSEDLARKIRAILDA